MAQPIERETATEPLTWDDADQRLGAAIRETRHARGLTLVQVASAAGLSHPFLSQLERGLAQPSMRSLFQIAEALGTTQQALLAAAGADDATVDLETGGGARLLGPSPAGTAVTEFVGPPREFAEFFRHDHAELLYVVAGSIEVEVHDDDGVPTTTTLRSRGTIGYPGGVDHRFRQVGEATAVVLAVHGAPDD